MDPTLTLTRTLGAARLAGRVALHRRVRAATLAAAGRLHEPRTAARRGRPRAALSAARRRLRPGQAPPPSGVVLSPEPSVNLLGSFLQAYLRSEAVLSPLCPPPKLPGSAAGAAAAAVPCGSGSLRSGRPSEERSSEERDVAHEPPPLLARLRRAGLRAGDRFLSPALSLAAGAPRPGEAVGRVRLPSLPRGAVAARPSRPSPREGVASEESVVGRRSSGAVELLVAVLRGMSVSNPNPNPNPNPNVTYHLPSSSPHSLRNLLQVRPARVRRLLHPAAHRVRGGGQGGRSRDHVV